jgi:hypothetical protein
VPERQALMDYKQFDYTPINAALRSKGGSPGIEKKIGAIDSVMEQFGLAEPVTVYRALKGKPPGHDPAYMSTSLDMQKALDAVTTMQGGGDLCVLELNVPKGTRGIYLDHPAFQNNYGGGGGYHFPREYELLLDRDLPYTITGSRKQNGVTVYEATIAPTDRPVHPRKAPELDAKQRSAAEKKAIEQLNDARYFPDYAEALYAMIRMKPVSATVQQALAQRTTELLDSWAKGGDEQSQPLRSIIDARQKLGGDDSSLAEALVGHLENTPIQSWAFVPDLVAALPQLPHTEAVTQAAHEVGAKIDKYLATLEGTPSGWGPESLKKFRDALNAL